MLVAQVGVELFDETLCVHFDDGGTLFAHLGEAEAALAFDFGEVVAAGSDYSGDDGGEDGGLGGLDGGVVEEEGGGFEEEEADLFGRFGEGLRGSGGEAYVWGGGRGAK